MGLRAGATTRTNTSTSTCAAPARNNVRVQASTVAPDVSTSSTSTRCRPATSTLCSGRDKKCPLDGIGALGSRPSDLLRCGADRLSPPCVTGTPPSPILCGQERPTDCIVVPIAFANAGVPELAHRHRPEVRSQRALSSAPSWVKGRAGRYI